MFAALRSHNRSRGLRAAVVAVLAITTGLMIGCGRATSTAPSAAASPQTAEQMLREANRLMSESDSIRVTGQLFDFSGPYDLTFNGRTHTATLSLTEGEGSVLTATRIGDDYYISGTDMYWMGIRGPKAADLLRGKVLKVAIKDATYWRDLESLLNPQLYLEKIGNVSRKPLTTINGIPVLPLQNQFVNYDFIEYVELGAGSTDVNITVGRPVRLETFRGTVLDFTYGSTAFSVDPPPATKLVDLKQLEAVAPPPGC